MGKLTDSLANAAGGIVGTGMGLLLQGSNDRRQIKQQQKLTNIQAAANKEQAKYSSELQYDMWNKTNYGAQKQHMENAGLNPGLMYGMGGGGGTTIGNASAQGVSGGSAQQNPGEMQQMMGMGLQMQAQTELLKAQKDNIIADTENKKADIPVKSTTVDKNAMEASAIQLDNDFKIIRNKIQSQTVEEAINTIGAEMDLAVAKFNEQNFKNSLNQETKQAQKDEIIGRGAAALVTKAAIEQGIKLDETKVKVIENSIKNSTKQLDLTEKGIETTKTNTETMARSILIGAGINAAGNIVKGLSDILLKGKGIQMSESEHVDKEGNISTTVSKKYNK